jgi:uncharacterized iron-regulated protein
MRNGHKIETIKRELFDRIRSQVADRLGLQDQEIKKSDQAFKRLFRKDWQRTTSQRLQKAINQSDVIFWADFHGVRQFQKNLLRWLKKQDLSSRSVVIALECLPVESQKWVDLFLASQISESEFLENVKWVKNWGFPWIHYKPLFDWARENKQILRVINAKSSVKSSVTREAVAINQVLEIKTEFPDSQIFVLYGEYHLLPARGFPAAIKKKKKLKSVFIFQNSDELYFAKPPKGAKNEDEIFQLNESFFCIQNVSPWVKWQNYNLFLEATQESDYEEDFELTEHVFGVSKILAETFHLELDPNDYAVFTSSDRALWDHLKKIPDSELRIFENLIEEGMSFVYRKGGWAFLGRISANETASLAMQSLIYQLNINLDWKMPEGDEFPLLVWVQAFSYFGSKIINPHRKTPSLLELQKKSKMSPRRPIERQAARLAVHYTLHQSLGSERPFQETSLSNAVRYQAIRWIAGLLGEKLFNAYNQGLLSIETLKSFLLKNPAERNFHIVIQNLYELVDSKSP